jgi:hypothetical protein
VCDCQVLAEADVRHADEGDAALGFYVVFAAWYH